MCYAWPVRVGHFCYKSAENPSLLTLILVLPLPHKTTRKVKYGRITIRDSQC